MAKRDPYPRKTGKKSKKVKAGRGPKSRLTRMQSLFVVEYLIDLNATQAAIRAGYSAKTAAAQGCHLMKNPIVARHLDRSIKAREQRLADSGDRVLQEAACYAFLDPIHLLNDNLDLKALSEMPEHARRAIAGFKIRDEYDKDGEKTATVTEVKLVPKDRGIDKLGQHHDLWGGTVKVELNVGQAIREGRRRAREQRDG